MQFSLSNFMHNKMCQVVWLLLPLVCISQLTDVKANILGWDDTIKEDLYAIYSHTALTERATLDTPVSPDEVKFYLFTSDNPDSYIAIDPSNPTQLNNKDAKIVFIIHGWLEYRAVPWYDDLKNSFLKRDPSYHVIQVDWSKYSFLGYLLSSYTTKDVGGVIGKFIVDLNTKYGIPLDNFLVVGHSLGGQISGFIGKKVQELTGKKLPRLVALDAAGPLFTDRPEAERLNKNDAEVVHAIHTDGGTFGFLAPIGTIDFFPNGGSSQPGCLKFTITDPATLAEPIYCDHQRSWKYFIEAVVKPNEFQGIKCRDWLTYATKVLCEGEDNAAIGDLQTKKTGNYYLKTASEPPYYKTNILNTLLP